MPAAAVDDRDGGRIDAPAQRRPERERVAGRMEAQRADPAERDERHAAERQRAAGQERGGEGALAQEQPRHRGGEERRGRDEDAHVGGVREMDRDVLQHLVGGGAREARAGEERLVAEAQRPHPVRVDRPQRDPGQREADAEDLQRREVREQRLRVDEGRAPYDYDERGKRHAGRRRQPSGAHAKRSPVLSASRRAAARLLPVPVK